VCITSGLALLFGRRRLRLTPSGLRLAWGRTLECVGLAVVFYALNVGLGIGVALLLRAAGRYSSLYTSGDVSLVVFSVLQALVFEWWRRARD
jgi:hypothetical protein